MFYEGEEYEIRFITPKQFNYQDRGMVKWMGMMLSDHSEALSQLKKEEIEAEPEGKTKQSIEEVSEYLYKAFLTNHPVKIQANFLKNGHYYKDVECIIKGHNGSSKVFLQLKNGELRQADIKDIRHMEWMEKIDWYEKRKSE